MSLPRQKFSREFKATVVKEVIERSRPIAEVAREHGIVAQTLGNWVNAYRVEHPDARPEPELSVSERKKLQELEKEVRELRMENEFLGKAAAFFARKPR